MGASRSRPRPDLTSDRRPRPITPAAVAEFAVGQVLRNGTALDTLPAILARLVTAFAGRSALALQPRTAQPPVVLAAYPEGAATDQALLTEFSALSAAPRDPAADGGSLQMPLKSGGLGMSVLLAYSAPPGGQCLCALALIGDASNWDEETRSIMTVVATTVAAQIGHDNDVAALADTEARFRLLAQLAPVGIVQNDARGRAIFVNDRWCAMTGVPVKAALGANWLDLVHPDDRGQVERDMAVAAAREGEMRTHCRLRAAGGGDLWVMASVVALYTAGDGPLGFLATFTDITDAKRAETERERLLGAEQAARASLADQTERLNCLIATAIPGILITDEQGLITHVNQSFGTMFGIESTDQLVGAPAGDAVRQIKGVFTDPGEFVRRTSEAFSTRQPVAGEQIACADGRTFDGGYWPTTVGGRDRGDLWLAWDVSDRKELEEQRERLLEAGLAARRSAELIQRQLEQQNEKLRELDETRTQFIATVSHELRTPLTSIVSFSELLKAETQSLTPDGAQFLAIIERNAHRLIRLVGDLLLLSHLESGSIPLELAPVSIPELTEEATHSASAGAAKRGVTVHFSADDGPLMQADRVRLFQVLDNLIANAIKFSRPNGLVRADAVWDGGGWRIDVADCGIGIPPNEVGQLFGRFVRASNARTAGLPGTGLGLSVVKAIVELHGGRVTVESALGRGTTFSVYLPAGHPHV
jgi:PAS domain S-box-containing protein